MPNDQSECSCDVLGRDRLPEARPAGARVELRLRAEEVGAAGRRSGRARGGGRSSSAPVKGRSVPASRATWYCERRQQPLPLRGRLDDRRQRHEALRLLREEPHGLAGRRAGVRSSPDARGRRRSRSAARRRAGRRRRWRTFLFMPESTGRGRPPFPSCDHRTKTGVRKAARRRSTYRGGSLRETPGAWGLAAVARRDRVADGRARVGRERRGEGAGAAARGPARASRPPTFAGGCFWCMESPFEKLPGVLLGDVRLHGGDTEEPDLRAGLLGRHRPRGGGPGRLRPAKVTYERLLEAFWPNVDPTVRNRQFCDVGEQYRTGDLRARCGAAEGGRGGVEGGAREVEAVQAADRDARSRTPAPFYPAEEYHQDYERRTTSATAPTARAAGATRGCASCGGRGTALSYPRSPFRGEGELEDACGRSLALAARLERGRDDRGRGGERVERGPDARAILDKTLVLRLAPGARPPGAGRARGARRAARGGAAAAADVRAAAARAGGGARGARSRPAAPTSRTSSGCSRARSRTRSTTSGSRSCRCGRKSRARRSTRRARRARPSTPSSATTAACARELLDPRSVVRGAADLEGDLLLLDRRPRPGGAAPGPPRARACAARFYAIPYALAYAPEQDEAGRHLLEAAAAVEDEDPDLADYLREPAARLPDQRLRVGRRVVGHGLVPQPERADRRRTRPTTTSSSG